MTLFAVITTCRLAIFGCCLFWTNSLYAQPIGSGIMAAQQALVRQTLQAIYNNNPGQANGLLNQLDQRTAHHPAVDLLRAVRLHWQWFPARTDERLRNQLVNLLEKTADETQTQLDKRPDDPELIFTYFTTEAMLTRMAYFDHQTLKSVGYAKKAYSYLQKGRPYRQQYPDFSLSSGLYDYYREEYPALHPVYKPLVWFMKSGDKQNGLAQLLVALRQSLFSQVEATLYLTHILTDYEDRASEALPYLAQLAKQYPNNPFFTARYAEVLLHAGRLAQATPLIDSLMATRFLFYQQFGQLLTARLKLAQGALTEADGLAQTVLQNPPKDEAYQAWAYAVRARVAAQTNQPKLARVFYKKVLDLAEYPILSREAKQYLK
ncbi:tetratricopeptide repeat protein [Fibrivirga algicola]|uniref:Tetratricopeptide repeat protein n=1 Tax=Fibrivirga algicola TaxID=2950420 RepID=A0ABX0QQQ8_9BACT|nr:tetratricopeptide repeat protein [Fibrivirga algicola]NID13626.1 tetratricopeptide repeat protein [Fibrivirga algicola]